MSQLQGTPHSVASMKANGHHNGDQTIQKLGRIRAGSLGHKQAESHAPTLKNQGKSDCTVRIVGISECETDIPIDSLSQEDDVWSSEAMQAVLTNARSPSSTPPRGGSLAVRGSRSLQAQRTLRRPTLEQRLSSSVRRKYDKWLVFNPANSYVSRSTIQRLTSSMWAVRKEAFSGAKQDGNRLLKQIQKQLAFSARCRTSNINSTTSTPEIYGVRIPNCGDLKSGFIVDMEYIPFNDVRHVMLEKDKPTNEWMINTAIDLVDSNLTLSSTAPLGDCLPDFLKKANSIKSAILKSSMLSGTDCQYISQQLDRVLDHFSNLSHINIPIGFCHGDFTFANMLVDTENREFCVFDFLDCFVESPLQDIAKLLQDARHQWFLTQTSIPGDRHGRAVAMLEFYHEKIKSAYYDYAFWDVVPLFEYFCLARILPYLTTTREKECVLNGLKRIYKGLSEEPDLPCDGDTIKSPVDLSQPYFEIASGTTVIVPALGPDMENAYPAGQIKLLALNSNGRPLIVDSMSSLSTENVSRIVVVVRRPVIQARCGNTSNFERLFDVLGADRCSKLDFLYAEDQTMDAAETVAMAIESKAINGPIFIKDADNDYAHSVVSGNYITFTSVIGDSSAIDTKERVLRPDLVDAARKSYVSFIYDNVISNVAYGSSISSNFCCGGWGFLRASDFLAATATLRSLLQTSGLTTESGIAREVKVVDVLWQLVCEDHCFFGLKVSGYKDWGSQAAWLAAISNIRY